MSKQKSNKRREQAAKRRAMKASQYRGKGNSRYAKKKVWRVKNIDGAPIPVWYGSARWEDARQLHNGAC